MFSAQSHLSLLSRICLALVLLLIAVPASAAHGEAASAAFSAHWLWYTGENAQEPSLVVDASNGMHAVYSTVLANNGGIYPVYYAYCPSNCSAQSNWSYVSLGDKAMFGGDVAIALTPTGKPRVMWYYYTLVGRKTYHYAECEGNCGSAANWKTTAILTAYPYSKTKQYFAVDPQGVAHFIYADSFNDPHNGTFYTSCASNCTNPASWTEWKIDSSESLSAYDLKFDAAGHPRLLYFDNLDLVYVECNSACHVDTNWVGVVIANRATDSMTDESSLVLEITSTGKPRVAMYVNDRLSYAWCNTGCSSSASNWTVTDLGFAKDYGLDPDLELDSKDRPIISYQVFIIQPEDGMHYSACTSGCESGSPVWSHQIVETEDQLNISDPVATPSGCQFNTWVEAGVDSAVGLNASDEPQFVYGAENSAICDGKVHSIIQGVRFATAGDSKPVLDKHTYLPAVRR